MLATLLLSILNFLWYGLFDLLWPKEIPFFHLASLQSALDQFSVSFLPAFKFSNAFLPLDTLFACTAGLMSIYMIIFIFQAARWVMSLIKIGQKG